MSVAVSWLGMPTFAGAAYTEGSQVSDTTAHQTIAIALLTLSGSYGTGTSHGDPLDWTLSGTTPPGAQPQGTNLSDYGPSFVLIQELTQAGSAATGYIAKYNPGPKLSTADGTTAAGGVLQIFGGATASGDGLNEITEGSAYSSFSPSLAGATFLAICFFPRS